MVHQRLPNLILLSCVLFLGGANPVHAQQTPHKVGLALSGGGARGAAHIGILKVFEREGIPIHCIAGTSFGALVGGLYSLGYTADEIEHIFTTQDWDSIFSDAPERRLTRLVLDRARTRWKEENYDLALKFLTDIEQDAALGCAAELDTLKRAIINSLVWHYRLVQIQEGVDKLMQLSAEAASQPAYDGVQPGKAVWAELIILVHALLAEDTSEEPARKQAWRIVYRAINWLGLPDEYLNDISDLGKRLNLSPAPVDESLKYRRNYVAQLQKDQAVKRIPVCCLRFSWESLREHSEHEGESLTA